MGKAAKGETLLLKNALIVGHPKPTDILLQDGVVAEVGDLSGRGLDVGGRLVTPGFVNAHTHLDKADLPSKMRPEDFGRSLEENRELLKSFKRGYTVREIRERALRVIDLFVENGVTSLRTQVDVDPTCGLKPIEALLSIRDEGGVRLQVCAFPQEGVVDEAKRRIVEAALESGADLLGGLPLVEKTREEQAQHIEILFELARKYDVDLEVQVDESNNPQDFMLPLLAEKAIEYGWAGRVSATHCISLSAQDDRVAREAIRLVVEAGLNVIVTPSANLITQFRVPDGVHARPSNSITRVKELLEAQVNVALGTDNVRDVFYPLGNCSMLREMHVLAAAARMTGAEDPASLFNMASANGARLMGLDYGVREGALADLVVLNAGSLRDALNGAASIPYVIGGGRILCESGLEVKHGRRRD